MNGVIFGVILMLLWGVGSFIQIIYTKKIGSIATQSMANILGLFPWAISAYILLPYISITMSNAILMVLSGICIVTAVLSMYRGVEEGTVALVFPISQSYALVAVILATFILGENFTIKQALGLLVLIIGIFLISGDPRSIKQIKKAKGIGYAFMAMFFFGVNYIVLGIINQEITLFGMYFAETNPQTLFALTVPINTLFFVMYATYKKQNPQKEHFKYAPFLFLSSCIFLAAWGVLQYGISVSDISIIAPIASLNPAITVSLSILFLNEKITKFQTIGLIISMIGIILIG